MDDTQANVLANDLFASDSGFLWCCHADYVLAAAFLRPLPTVTRLPRFVRELVLVR